MNLFDIEVIQEFAMSYSASWFSNDEQIIKLQLDEPISWDDFHHMVDEVTVMIKEVEDRIDIISITNGNFPKGNPMPHMRRLERLIEDNSNLGAYIIVRPKEANIIIKTFMSIFQSFGMKMAKSEFTESVEEAYEKIMQHRAQ